MRERRIPLDPESGGIPHLFRTSLSPHIGNSLMGLSQQQQQQQQQQDSNLEPGRKAVSIHPYCFLARDSMLSALYAIARPSVRLSVRHTGGSVKNG